MTSVKNATLRDILSRSSYRGAYECQSVPRDDLTLILRAGLSAPSGCNRQTTALIAVDDEALLKDLKALIDPPVAVTAPAFICVLTLPIAAYADRYFYVQDYAAAIENMLVAIHALGYESCWYEGHITGSDDIAGRLAARLGVPGEYRLTCILPVGRPAEAVKRVRKKPFAARAWFNGFGKDPTQE